MHLTKDVLFYYSGSEIGSPETPTSDAHQINTDTFPNAGDLTRSLTGLTLKGETILCCMYALQRALILETHKNSFSVF